MDKLRAEIENIRSKFAAGEVFVSTTNADIADYFSKQPGIGIEYYGKAWDIISLDNQNKHLYK